MLRPSRTTLFILLFVTTMASAHAKENTDKQDHQIKVVVLFSLIPVVVAFSFIVFVFYRAKREAHFKQKEAEFRLNTAELEMKALRAQINPHFIFNCLNSIHHFMHHHGAQRTGDYLIKFSQLIRYALETSSSHMVPLSEDLEALKAYIELEQLRMQSSFEYTIDVSGIMDLNNIQIPPMMIQPFVENSIWHGLNSKGNGGLIAIRLNKRDDMMHCVIEDNGIPTTGKNIRATMPTVRKTSMGMALIRERLAMVNRLYNVKADFTIEDRINDAISQEGTRVNILLPFEE